MVVKCVQVLKTNNSVYDMIKPSGAFCLLGECVSCVSCVCVHMIPNNITVIESLKVDITCVIQYISKCISYFYKCACILTFSAMNSTHKVVL